MKQAFTVLAVMGILLLIGLTIVGNLIPETYVYLGREVPKRFTNEIKELGILKEDEQLKYFYTIGLFDIKEGLYFVTNTKFVAYCKDWEEPEASIYFEDVIDLDITYNESFFEDSFITIETMSGFFIEFPISSEKDRDKIFYDYLVDKAELEARQNDMDVFLDSIEREYESAKK